MVVTVVYMLSDDQEEEGITIPNKGLALLMLGISLVFVGIAVIAISSILLGGSGSIGGVILIGPIPIVFGSGPEAGWLIAVGIALTIISAALFLVLNRRARRA